MLHSPRCTTGATLDCSRQNKSTLLSVLIVGATDSAEEPVREAAGDSRPVSAEAVGGRRGGLRGGWRVQRRHLLARRGCWVRAAAGRGRRHGLPARPLRADSFVLVRVVVDCERAPRMTNLLCSDWTLTTRRFLI